MSLQVENLEHNMAKLTIQASAEDFEKAIQRIYVRSRNRISIPGFRRGKAPRKLIEKMYGESVFYEDAANSLISESYRKEIEEHEELDIVSRPDIDVVQIESGKPFIYTALVALKPGVELGKYKGVKCVKAETDVTDEEVEEELKRQQDINSRMVDADRPVQDKDIVTIDFEGLMDGVPFDGGKGEDYNLTIGSHTFIDNFEEQLIGKNKDENVEVNVTFPEDYGEKKLAGKPAVFKVLIKGIREKEMPELDDEFASEISEFDTMDEYRADLKEKIKKQKEDEEKARQEDELLEAIIADSNMDIPEAMVKTETDMLMENYSRQLSGQGLDMDSYLNYTGMNRDLFESQMKDQAMKNIQSRLVLEAIVSAEDIKADDEAFEEEISKTAKRYRVTPEKMKEIMGEKEQENIKKDLCMKKAVDMIFEEKTEYDPGENNE